MIFHISFSLLFPSFFLFLDCLENVVFALLALLLQLLQGFNRVLTLVEHGEDSVEVKQLRKEVVDAKKAAKDAVARIAVLEKEKTETGKIVTSMKERNGVLVTDKKALSALVVSYQKIEANLNASLTKARNDHVDEVARLETDLEAVREELRLSREENLKSFEEGYVACWDRANKNGYAMNDHSFEAYCQDLARERDGAASSNRVVEKDP